MSIDEPIHNNLIESIIEATSPDYLENLRRIAEGTSHLTDEKKEDCYSLVMEKRREIINY